MRNAVLAGICAGLFALAGCAGHHTSPQTARMLDDKVIGERVEMALRRVSPAEFSNVQVHSADAVVTLNGSVHSLQAKERASQISKSVEKVRKVDNEIQVR